MDKKKFAFVGKESYDLVLYAGAILKRLGYTLTVFDVSPLRDMMSVIPGVRKEYDDIEYGDIHICWSNYEQVETEEFCLVYAGLNVNHPLVKESDELWIFTDHQLQYLRALNSMSIPEEQARFCVYRSSDIVRASDKLIVNELKDINITFDNFLALENITADFQFRCQYDSRLKFANAPASVKRFIHFFLGSDFTQQELDTAIKEVSRKK